MICAGLFIVLRKPEADAANVAAAFFKLSDIWREADEAALFEFSLELRGVVRHNDMFASANKVVGEALGALVIIDNDFIDIFKRVDFALRFFIESVAAISDGVLVDDRDSKVDVIPEAVSVISERIDMFGTIVVELWQSMNLNELKAESVGSELLSFRIGAIATASKEIFAAN